MEYPTIIYVTNALHKAIEEMQRGIISCGELTGNSSKQPPKNIEYFKSLSETYKKGIAEVKELIKTLNGEATL